jgi:ribosomal protein L7/L12
MAQVFLSYSKTDRALAERFVRALRAEGLTVWWDDDLHPRTSWDRMIEIELDAAEAVLVLWTSASVQSDWVKSEADFALQSDPPKLIQARIGGCRVPLGFNRKQYLEVDGEAPQSSLEWSKLVRWLRPFTVPPVTAPAAPAAARVREEARPDVFEVVLVDDGGQKINVIKEIRAITGLGLVEAKTLVESLPRTVAKGLTRHHADRIASQLISAGATVKYRPQVSPSS